MTRSTKPYRRTLSAALALLLGLLVPTTTPQAQSRGNPGVIPPQAKPHGLSYGDWSAKWWQWAISIPAATNPLEDATGANCAEGQTGSVWFLAGTTGTSAVTRTCTVPVGKALFFPLLNAIFGSGTFDCDPSSPGVPCDVNALRSGAAAFMDNPILLEASIDGHALQDLSNYRAVSPVFSITVPSDPIFGLPLTGTFAPQVSDGYWLMLTPLSAGEHTIHCKATTNANIGFTVEVTYHLTVAPN